MKAGRKTIIPQRRGVNLLERVSSSPHTRCNRASGEITHPGGGRLGGTDRAAGWGIELEQMYEQSYRPKTIMRP